MTSLTFFYFTSILLTFILTGFLAWYAWRKPALPGVRAYAWLSLSQSLLALTEILSMVSHTQALALFWFNLRFIFITIIPILWLAFSLEYNGGTGWLSKRMLVVLFIIPLITQVMLWTNPLHGQWITREVAFSQNGPFWIADTSARIPALWYMLSSFYSVILLLAGLGVVLLTTFRAQQRVFIQAILLSAGGLVSLLTTLLPILTFLPKTPYNLFIPGMGMSSLLIALAVFRFQFLRNMPREADGSIASFSDAHGKSAVAQFVLVFIFMVTGLTTAGYVSYQNYRIQYRTQVENQLSAIAGLKIDELVDWRAERLADAETFANNPIFADLVQQFLEDPQTGQAKEQLLTWMDTLGFYHQYDQVSLLDPLMVDRLSTSSSTEPLGAYLSMQAAAALASGQLTMVDFYRETFEAPIRLAFLVPIFSPADGHSPVGVLVMRIDPNVYLYPFINKWPSSSETAETLIVRRDGNTVMYLNELRFVKDTALNMRKPLSDTENLAVQAVLGRQGIVQGMDYRNQEVLGYVSAVPDSPWFLVARMDVDEVYAPLTSRVWQTVLFFGALILAAGGTMGAIWRQQRVRYFRSQVETLSSLKRSEEQTLNSETFLNRLIDQSPLAIWISDDQGTLIRLNQACCDLLSITAAEVIGRYNIFQDNLVIEQGFLPRVQAVFEKGETARFEIIYDSSLVKGLDLEQTVKVILAVTIFPITDTNGRITNAVIQHNNITDQKLAEQARLESEERFSTIFHANPVPIALTSVETNQLSDVNQAWLDITGYETTEVIGKTPFELDLWVDSTQRDHLIGMVREHGQGYGEVQIRGKAGEIRDLLMSAEKIELSGNNYLLTMAQDITERKQAEQALQDNEKKVRRMFEHQVAINQLSLALGESLNLEQVYHTVCGHIRQLVDVWCFIVSSFDEPSGLIRAEYCESDKVYDVSGFPAIPLGEADKGTQSRVIHTGQLLYTPDHQQAVKESQVRYTIEEDGSVHDELPEEKEKADTTRSVVYLPMKVKGKTIGVMQVQSTRLNAYGEDDIALLAGIANVVAVASQNARLYQEVEYELGQRKLAEQELKNYSDRLEEMVDERTHSLSEAQERLVRQERLATLGQVAGNIGHELRNPLGVISNAVYFLKMTQPDADHTVKEYLQIIENETRASDKFITDLLDFTRLKAIDRKPAFVPGLIDQTLERHPIPSSVQLTLDLPAELPPVLADPHHVVQVLGNLIHNACQAMQDGGKLTISAIVKKDVVRIAVQDTGTGILPEHMGKLFEPLFTTKNKGIGLGLSVSRKLAEANGGRVDVKSKLGQGSIFTLSLPIAPS
jgi:PAS domain S-box-containing protein